MSEEILPEEIIPNDIHLHLRCTDTSEWRTVWELTSETGYAYFTNAEKDATGYPNTMYLPEIAGVHDGEEAARIILGKLDLKMSKLLVRDTVRAELEADRDRLLHEREQLQRDCENACSTKDLLRILESYFEGT